MSNEKYIVYFNAVSTEHGKHLFAAGWTLSAGLQPVLKQDVASSNFIFYVEKIEEYSAEVITPFQFSARITGNPKSVSVMAKNTNYQIQLMGLKVAKPGQNKAGDWVEI